MKSILSSVTFAITVLAITFGLSGFAGMNAFTPGAQTQHASSFILNGNPLPQSR